MTRGHPATSLNYPQKLVKKLTFVIPKLVHTFDCKTKNDATFSRVTVSFVFRLSV